jgi:hypothetical protein
MAGLTTWHVAVYTTRIFSVYVRPIPGLLVAIYAGVFYCVSAKLTNSGMYCIIILTKRLSITNRPNFDAPI